MQQQAWLIVVIGSMLAGLWVGVSQIQAGTNALTVSATVLSPSFCKFANGSKTSSINFGALNPASLSNTTVSTTADFWCIGIPVTYLITHDGGLYNLNTAQNRMRHTTVTTDYLPYTLSLNPASASGAFWTTQTLTITGTVAANDVQNARIGNYQDTVIISIIP